MASHREAGGKQERRKVGKVGRGVRSVRGSEERGPCLAARPTSKKARAAARADAVTVRPSAKWGVRNLRNFLALA